MMDPALFLSTVMIVFGYLTASIITPFWLRHRRESTKLKLEFSKETRDQGHVKVLTERLENLETLICRLDSEMNSRLERSFSMLKLGVDSNTSGVSQMPTTFVNIS